MTATPTTGGKSFKLKLARVFDDSLHTKQWHNIVDWIIMTMILISTAEIFVSTFKLNARWHAVLKWIDFVTLIFFTIEVSLRIWVAPYVNAVYSGLKGRLKYCCTFYGAIDVLSTYPFYLQFFFPLPVAAFKMLRIARVIRIMRIGRYSKSFSLLSSAICEKKRELIVSMQFLIIITLILSLILFFAEHEKQPEVYDNGFVSVIWAFAQYIGDPGQFADTPPITGVGRIVACIVGLLGIAIVAVPAGIIGAGFTEALEKEAKRDELITNSSKLRNIFQRKLDRPTGYQTVVPFVTLTQVQARTGLKTDEIIDVVNSGKTPYFRIINTASTIPVDEHAADQLAIEHFFINRSYGSFIDRGSNITIINPSAVIDAGSGNFSFYLALIGGFNYISREIGDRADWQSFFIRSEAMAKTQECKDFTSDVEKLLSRHGAWSLTILVSSGALEPVLPTHLHFGIGGDKGEEFDMADPLVKDFDTYRKLYDLIAIRCKDRLGLESDHQKYYNTSNRRMIFRNIDAPESNNVVLRLEWNKILWDPRRMILCRLLAEAISEVINDEPLTEIPELKIKRVGFDGYFQ